MSSELSSVYTKWERKTFLAQFNLRDKKKAAKPTLVHPLEHVRPADGSYESRSVINMVRATLTPVDDMWERKKKNKSKMQNMEINFDLKKIFLMCLTNFAISRLFFSFLEFG